LLCKSRRRIDLEENCLRRFELLTVLSILVASPMAASSQSPAGDLSGNTALQVVTEAQNTDVQATDLGNIPKILSILVTTTKFANHVNLNGKLQDSWLNIYVLAPGLKQRKSVPDAFLKASVFGNCGFVGVDNAIVCDSDFLSGFLAEHQIVGEPSDKPGAQGEWTFQDAFLAWILGHELGHVVEGGPAAHFGQANVLDKAADASIELSQKVETAADLFAAKKLEADKKLTGTLERLLLALIDREVEVKNGQSPAYGVGLHWDYADKAVIAYFANRDHPEFVVRATRILTLLAADTHEEGLEALLESFTRHLVPLKDGQH
jgi:hypothetical protein